MISYPTQILLAQAMADFTATLKSLFQEMWNPWLPRDRFGSFRQGSRGNLGTTIHCWSSWILVRNHECDLGYDAPSLGLRFCFSPWYLLQGMAWEIRGSPGRLTTRDPPAPLKGASRAMQMPAESSFMGFRFCRSLMYIYCFFPFSIYT